MKILPIFILTLLPLAVSATVSDTAKEQRWVDQVVDALIDGEALMLEASGQEFLTILTPAEEPKGAVLLIHGSGAHPDWPEVIQPLRVTLPEHGWTTLSVQMPLPPEGAGESLYGPLFDEANLRLSRAVETLSDLDIPVYIISHSFGGAHTAWFLAREPASGIGGWIGVGMNATHKGLPDQLDTVNNLPGITIPVLDLYGEDDLPGVISSAALRQQSAAGPYQQQVAPGADHFFRDREEDLLKRVLDWLSQSLPDENGVRP